MHDIKYIRENPAAFDAALARRGLAAQAQALLTLDAEKRGGQTDMQALLARRNEVAKQIGQCIKSDPAKAELLKTEAAALKEKIAAMEGGEEECGALRDALSRIPNLLADDVPDGADETGNVELRRWVPMVADVAAGVNVPPPVGGRLGGGHYLSPTERLTPPPHPSPYGGGSEDHVALGEALGMMDFETAAKMSGSRFVVLRGALARLERALAAFMLDIHTNEFGYTEHQVPYLVKDTALFGTNQLPKFAEDLFRTTGDHWLIPTSEVSLTNMVAGDILDEAKLPLRLTAHTPCFRSEAGSAGRDTRGMIRQHQFSKVELVSITRPEDSAAEHERMAGAAEEVLKRLGLHYRVMLLCAGDTGFGAKKTYDLEVWLPGQNAFREISSCSNCGDFQARRMKARFRRAGAKETEFVHTLNGSGLAVGRTLVAVMEHYQQPDGSIKVPDALVPYMGGLREIRR